ncbi:hypothetical protein ACFXA2_06935 [Micromonospora chalcea]
MDRRTVELALEKRADRLPKGWVLEASPDPESLPDPLRGRAVDAVARGNGKGVVFEVIAGRRELQLKTKSGHLQQLRASVARVPGWDFELVILPEPPPPLLPETDIDERYHSAMVLLNREPVAAFLTGFIVLEWSLANLAMRAGIDYDPNAQRLATALAEEGLVDKDVLTSVRAFQDMRNRLMHAVEGPRPTKVDVKELLSTVGAVRSTPLDLSH